MQKAVIGIVLSDNETSLVALKRRDVPMWVLPGGGIEPGESEEEAILREIKEETGLDAAIVRKAAEYTPHSSLATETSVFICRAEKGELTLGDETASIGSFRIDALPNPFFYIHKGWVDEALNNPHRIVRRPLAEVNYRALACYFVKHPLHVVRFALSRLGFPLNSR